MAIKNQSLVKLPNGIHFTHVDQSITRVEGAGIENELVVRQLGRLKTAFAEEDRCFKLSQKSLLSDKIREADTNRDRVYVLIKKTVDTYMELPLADYSEPASVVHQKLRDYHIDTREKLQSETGKLDNLLQDLKELENELQKLGLAQLVADLKKYNDEVKHLMMERADERAPRVAGELRAARHATDVEYAELIELINAMLKLFPSAALTKLEQQMNADIDYLRRQVLRSGSSQNAAEDGGDDDEDNGSSGSGSGDGGNSGGDSGNGSGDGGNSGGDSGSGSGDGGNSGGGDGSGSGGSGSGSGGNDSGSGDGGGGGNDSGGNVLG